MNKVGKHIWDHSIWMWIIFNVSLFYPSCPIVSTICKEIVQPSYWKHLHLFRLTNTDWLYWNFAVSSFPFTESKQDEQQIGTELLLKRQMSVSFCIHQNIHVKRLLSHKQRLQCCSNLNLYKYTSNSYYYNHGSSVICGYVESHLGYSIFIHRSIRFEKYERCSNTRYCLSFLELFRSPRWILENLMRQSEISVSIIIMIMNINMFTRSCSYLGKVQMRNRSAELPNLKHVHFWVTITLCHLFVLWIAAVKVSGECGQRHQRCRL